jgi:hypothetical protein
MSTKSEGNLRTKRILANCKKIWGSDSVYDLEQETDDYKYYLCLVRKEYDNCFGSPLIFTTSHNGPDAAWADIDRMLAFRVRKAEAEGRVEKKDQGGMEKIHEGQVEKKDKGKSKSLGKMLEEIRKI